MKGGIHIKVCGLTEPENARAVMARPVDYGGVNVYAKSPRAVPRERVPEVLAAIPGGRRVLVTVNPGTDELEAWSDLGFDKYQIHCDLETPLVSLAAWAGIVGRENLWVAPRIPPGEPFPQAMLEFADTVLLDTFARDKHGGTGKTGDWGKFAEWSTLYAHKRWLLAGGLRPENIAEAVRVTGARCIDLNSGIESEPGVKDLDRLDMVLAALPDD